MPETQATISAWAEETFGPSGSLFRVATRANEEMAELLTAIAKGNDGKAAEELADVVIVLARVGVRVCLEDAFFPRGGDPVSPSYEGYSRETFAAEMNEHFAALLVATADTNNPNGVNAVIRLYSAAGDLADSLGIDLQEQIDRKMEVNRARQWNLDGSGHGYHVKPETAPEPAAPDRAALMLAHDRLGAVLNDAPDLGLHNDQRRYFAGGRDALCWVLGHEDGPARQFSRNLTILEGEFKRRGIVCTCPECRKAAEGSEAAR